MNIKEECLYRFNKLSKDYDNISDLLKDINLLSENHPKESGDEMLLSVLIGLPKLNKALEEYSEENYEDDIRWEG